MTEETVQTEDLEQQVETTEETTEELDLSQETDEGSDKPLEGEEVSKPSRSQNAKQRLRRKLRESEDDNKRLSEQATKNEERLASLEEKLEGVVNPPEPRPTRVDFETEEDYEDKLFEWRDVQKPQAKPVTKQAEVAERPQLEVPQEAKDNWADQLDNMAEKHEDFEDVLVSIPDESMTAAMTLTIMESDSAGEIAYFLGNNHKEATRIASLTAPAQVREIDKLGSKLKNNTSAPDPLKTVQHRGDTVDETVDPLLNGATFT